MYGPECLRVGISVSNLIDGVYYVMLVWSARMDCLPGWKKIGTHHKRIQGICFQTKSPLYLRFYHKRRSLSFESSV